MRHMGFHHDPHHEMSEDHLLILGACLFIAIVVALAIWVGGQLPTWQTPWGGDFLQPTPMQVWPN